MKRLAPSFLAAALCFVPHAARAAGPAALSDYGWLAGRWIDDSGGNLSEETWSAPAGDAMQGMWRYVVDGKARIYEILTLSAEEGGLVMRIRHFDPKLVAREDKSTPVVLKLVSTGARSAVFEGPEVGGTGLVRLTYAMPSDAALRVTLEKDGKKQGFTFRRATP
jgi:Domain of unknown function (DUF6265)